MKSKVGSNFYKNFPVTRNRSTMEFNSYYSVVQLIKTYEGTYIIRIQPLVTVEIQLLLEGMFNYLYSLPGSCKSEPDISYVGRGNKVFPTTNFSHGKAESNTCFGTASRQVLCLKRMRLNLIDRNFSDQNESSSLAPSSERKRK